MSAKPKPATSSSFSGKMVDITPTPSTDSKSRQARLEEVAKLMSQALDEAEAEHKKREASRAGHGP